MFNYKIIDNLISPSECQQIIETYKPLLGELIEFTDYQHSRYNFTNIALSDLLFERIKNQLPDEIVEISHKWYMSHYQADQGSISEHFDGNILWSDKISRYTFLIYLNDNFKEGETVINDPRYRRHIPIAPRTGRILLLDQDMLHYAKKPTEGDKYILRSDLMVMTEKEKEKQD